MNPKIEKLKQEQAANEAEIRRREIRLEQIEHDLERYENRKKYLSDKERARRTHQLCSIGGVIEHFFPAAKEMTREEFYKLVEKLSVLPEVQKLFDGR